jgi:hypothetical protein
MSFGDRPGLLSWTLDVLADDRLSEHRGNPYAWR